MNSYPNARDCEHGCQRGKCPECDVQQLEAENAELKKLCGDVWEGWKWDRREKTFIPLAPFPLALFHELEQRLKKAGVV